MTIKPILFRGPMIRALLDGRKTMTRRVLKPQPPANVTSAGVISTSAKGQTNDWTWLSGDPRDCDSWMNEGDFHCRYAVGDLAWVREAWRSTHKLDDSSPAQIAWQCHEAGYGEAWAPIEYEADHHLSNWSYDDLKGRLRASMHMPKWASRITLQVTSVKVERLQDISRGDAMEEGCPFPNMAKGDDPRKWFSELWESINGEGSWDANPWVVAVSFKVHKCNVSAMT